MDVEKTGRGFAGGILGDISSQDAQHMVEQTKQAMDQAVEQVSDFIREKPIACLAGALAFGYLVGKIASR
ncbi:MAG: hypothetical protein E6J85_07340 [Deltaproteobacteria bacterium]|nr:MAG: hypothetical protein E6J85_07340 [Deltaproteobacteria bacterium]TMB28089.1 MAG: hypothetical protein E6J61_18890 [Deltaproteobacteria bacterium]